MLHSSNVVVRKVTLLDCAWASNSWCSGALQFAHLDSVEINQLDINEGRGYGIKSLPHDKNHQLRRFKMHDSKISVNPKGVWQNGKAPNIAVEIWAASFIESEIYNCYFDNHVSIVNADHTAEPTGDVFRIHRNFFDIAQRANGQGYGIELDIHNAEIDHNIFKGGYCGIANWSNPKTNWSIHHNIFFGQASPFPAGIINLHNGNMKSVSIYNNTAELSGETSISFLECGEGGSSTDIVIKNNLVLSSGSAKRKLITLRKGATIKDLVVENNLLYNVLLEDCTGVVRQNIFADPGIMRVGSRPFPYYLPAPHSPLIKAGAFMKTSSRDNPPDIGAYEKR
jgi:hypothetical protein